LNTALNFDPFIAWTPSVKTTEGYDGKVSFLFLFPGAKAVLRKHMAANALGI
jgi:hypothetical protein